MIKLCMSGKCPEIDWACIHIDNRIVIDVGAETSLILTALNELAPVIAAGWEKLVMKTLHKCGIIWYQARC